MFAGELAIAEALFTHNLRRRKIFFLRLFLCLIVYFSVAVFFPLPEINTPQYSLLVFFTQFVLSLVLLLFLFKEPFLSLFFCGIAAYAVQHLAYQCFSLIVYTAGLNGNSSMGLYGQEEQAPFDWRIIPVYVAVEAAIYWLAILLFSNRIKKGEDLRVKSVLLFSLFVLFATAVIIVNIFVAYETFENFNITYIIAASISGALCCLFVLFLLFTLLSRENLKTKNEYMNRLWRQEQRQLATSRASMDMIKRACHDLKYSMRAINERNCENDENFLEIKKAVEIYDSYAETGNNALDVILTERASLCTEKNIRFDCMADGRALSFINDVDLYTLFGNALDNAIEATEKNDLSKRVISLSVVRTEGILSVSIRNYYTEKIVMRDGLPVTTKNDAEIHGYGMSSIKRITEKYGGNMQIFTKDEIFSLNLLFFISNTDFED